MLNVSNLRLVCLTVVLDLQTLDIHYNLGNIFLHAGDRAELVQYAVNLDLAHCRAGK